MGKNSKAGQDIFWSRDFVTSGEKGPTRADSAQLSVEHAQNTLPDMASSGHVTSAPYLFFSYFFSRTFFHPYFFPRTIFAYFFKSRDF
jgi:hypothetical protein